MSMPIKQRVIEHIIPKKLALIDRVWTNADQSKTTQTYMARLWQPAVKRYSFVKLESTSIHNAKQECFEHWTKHAGDIKEGRDIGSHHRKLRTFIDEFVDVPEFEGTRQPDYTETCSSDWAPSCFAGEVLGRGEQTLSG